MLRDFLAFIGAAFLCSILAAMAWIGARSSARKRYLAQTRAFYRAHRRYPLTLAHSPMLRKASRFIDWGYMGQ